MDKQLRTELRAIKSILAKITGTTDLPESERFSVDALDNAAKHYKKMLIERGDWIQEYEIEKVIKNAPYNAGAFIRTQLGFTNFFTRGKKYYYNKPDLVALAKELKDRNVDLKSYMEFLADEEKFRKALSTALTKSKDGKGKKFSLPYDLQDIVSSPPKAPSPDVIREDIKRLKEEFFRDNLAGYINIYKGSHAMVKFEYHFDKYIKPEIKKQCRKLCENFNYANHALRLVTNKTEKFIPVKDDDMIQL
jgi:hypothetical protein